MKKAIIINDFKYNTACLHGLEYGKLCLLAEFRANVGRIKKRFATIQYKDEADLVKKLEKKNITSHCKITLAMYEAEIKRHFGLSEGNDYNVFLLIELAREHGVIDRMLESDLMWEQGFELYKEFETQGFNDMSKDLSECLWIFLSTKDPKFQTDEQPSQELIDEVLTEIQKDVNSGDLTAIEGMLQLVPVNVLKDYLPE